MSPDDQPIETGLTGLQTGLVTVAVTPPKPVEPAPPAVIPPAALPVSATMPDGWDLPKVASFITDVAQNMYDIPYLLKKHNLTEAQYETLQANEFFKRALEAEILTWSSTNSIQKRLALESAIAVEAALPTIAARLRKPTEPLADVVALVKVFAEMAGTIGAKAQTPLGSGEKFKIIINLGGEVTSQEVSVTPLQHVPQGSSENGAVRENGKTTANAEALRALAEGSRSPS